MSATAALTELSDDGAMLRNISAIVALLELEERSSTEHAIVGYAAARAFPASICSRRSSPRRRKKAQAYDDALTSAPEDVLRGFEGARDRLGAQDLLDAVLRSTEDTVSSIPAPGTAPRGGDA